MKRQVFDLGMHMHTSMCDKSSLNTYSGFRLMRAPVPSEQPVPLTWTGVQIVKYQYGDKQCIIMLQHKIHNWIPVIPK